MVSTLGLGSHQAFLAVASAATRRLSEQVTRRARWSPAEAA